MTSARIRAAAALSVLVLAAACGGGDQDDDGGGKGGDKGSDSGADFAKQPAADIADAAKADMKELDSVRYAGDISSSGEAISLDIQASSAGDCTGSIGLGEGSAELLAKDGETWFRPDEAFWRQQVPDQADLIISTVGDKWVVDSNAEFAQFCDLDEFFDQVFADAEDDSDYTTVGTDELDGQDVVKVENTTDQGTATGYVAVDDPHYLLMVERAEGEDPGKITFGDFDEEVDVETPGEDEVIDLSQQ